MSQSINQMELDLGSSTPNMASNEKDVGQGEEVEEVDADDNEEKPTKKRKGGSTSRSEVWVHFTKKENDKAECNYCEKVYQCNPQKNGTSTLKAHLQRCKKNPHSAFNNLGKNQSQLTLECFKQDKNAIEKAGSLSVWKFDQEVIRKALAHMIIVDELPFKFVEALGFRHFCAQMQPRFQIPSRTTIARDCYEMFADERVKLKNFLKSNCKRIALTTDTWTSNQRVNYLCLTGHFIDNNWKLQKRILNFCPIFSHRGEDIGKTIEDCLLEWEIEKVMCVTVDNAASNDIVVGYLKKKVVSWGGAILKGEFLHMRCVAHIMNLVVNDGLKLANDSITCVRNAVRYVRQSPARMEKFKACVEKVKIQNKSMLCLDVPTRWNSTYLMLDVAYKFRKAFDRLGDDDPFFRADLLQGDGLGKPEEDDWEKVNILLQLLECFYHLTLRVSGSSYATSNIYFGEISNVYCLLKQWCENDDSRFSDMASKMMEKYEKYWGNPEKLNMMMFIVVVLDPRYKFEIIDFGICQIYTAEKSKAVIAKLRKALYGMFEEYKGLNPLVDEKLHTSTQSSSCNLTVMGNTFLEKRKLLFLEKFKNYKAEIAGEDHKSELDMYLEERIEGQDDENFDILTFWKNNVTRYPILSLMARDVLAIPISTIASESAFSTGSRVLDPFRSSLTPRLVESLICAQDWLQAFPHDSMEESEEEAEKLEKDLSKIKLAHQVIDIHK